ncbi:hypothetical protein [Flavobacterium sp. 3-210]
MIKTTIPVKTELRGIEKSIVQVEVISYKGTPEGNFYTVNDFAVSIDSEGNTVKKFIQEKTVFYPADKINQLNEYLESQNDYSTLTKMERDWSKIKQGLLIDTQTNLYEDGTTIYEIQPINWELC